jgi:hypothetical protein
MSLIFKVNDKSLCVSGATFNIKEKLKLLGAKWSPSDSSWHLQSDIDSADLRSELEAAVLERRKKDAEIRKAEREEEKAEKAFYETAEGRKFLLIDALKIKEKTGGRSYHWICCMDCEIIDWKRQHTSCVTCGHDGNTFFVGGRLRTGD